MKTKLLFLTLCWMLQASPLTWAYTDTIAADVPEVFEAAKQVLSEYGIRKSDPEAGTLESQWIEERVKRERQILLQSVKKSFWQRYRLKIKLEQHGAMTEIAITGTYQRKSSSPSPSIPWKPIKAKDRRRRNKRLGEHHCQAILMAMGEQTWLKWLKRLTKKDDAADAFLQAGYFLRYHGGGGGGGGSAPQSHPRKRQSSLRGCQIESDDDDNDTHQPSPSSSSSCSSSSSSSSSSISL